jgi:hypothetical protein
MNEADAWRFVGAVCSAQQDHKARGKAQALLRADYPLTKMDKAVLADYLDFLEARGTKTAGAKRADHPSNLFTTEWAVHDAALEARKF